MEFYFVFSVGTLSTAWMNAYSTTVPNVEM